MAPFILSGSSYPYLEIWVTKKRLLERIVGALLVSAFCFILYSIFLDSETQHYIDRSTQIPLMPEFIEPLEIEETQIVIEEPVKSPVDTFIPTEEVSSQQAIESPILEISETKAEIVSSKATLSQIKEEQPSGKEVDEVEGVENQVVEQKQVIPNAWVIQVGSFSGVEKADQIVNQLISKSFKSYHRDLSRDDLYRVLIGPYIDADQAVRDQRQVDSILGVSTLLMKFEP